MENEAIIHSASLALPISKAFKSLLVFCSLMAGEKVIKGWKGMLVHLLCVCVSRFKNHIFMYLWLKVKKCFVFISLRTQNPQTFSFYSFIYVRIQHRLQQPLDPERDIADIENGWMDGIIKQAYFQTKNHMFAERKILLLLELVLYFVSQ